MHPSSLSLVANLQPQRLGVCLLLFLQTLAFAGPPAIRAKVEEPVLEELMGGCSLLCAFRWTGMVKMPAATAWEKTAVLNDDTALTAWKAADPKVGVGVKFHLVFPKKLPPGSSGEIPLYGLDLVNGYWKTEELWADHARIKLARIHYAGRPFRDVHYADTRRWQRITFPDIFVEDGDSMMIEVLEVYPGRRAGLAVTEIVLQGAH
jgi:hypothetical protein